MPPKKPRKAANGYKLPDPIPAGEVITAGKRSWRLGRSVGVGGFGEIYLCDEDRGRPVSEADAPFAVKIEPHENGPLFVEMNFYIRAAQPDAVATFAKACRVPGGTLGMPVYRGSGSHTFNGTKYRFLVMDRFGKDLQGPFESGKNPFSCQVAFTLAAQVIHVLEYIHSHGYAHNDVKAQNMLLGHGRGKERDVFLVDFGLVSKYERGGVHLEYKPDPRKMHDGTIEYASRDAHIGVKGRRSDLEVLAYNVVHWMSGALPWMDNLTDPKHVQKQKEKHMADVPALLRKCFGGGDYPEELEAFLDYVNELEFHAKPDYAKCVKMFTDGLKKRKLPTDGKVDLSAAKSPANKRTPKKTPKKSPAKKVRSATPKRTPKAAVKSAEGAKAKKGEVVSGGVVKKRKYKDSAAQTSPAFVKSANEAAKAKKARLGGAGSKATKEARMAEERGRAAIMTSDDSPSPPPPAKRKTPTSKKRSASSGTPKQRTSKKVAAVDANGGGGGEDNGMSNPTPAMLALMEKKRLADSAKKKPAKRQAR